MPNKRFTAKKVGDQYVLVPQGTEQQVKRGAFGVFGVIAVLLGLKRGGLLGLLLTLFGAGYAYRSFSGRNPIDQLLGKRRGGRRGAPSDTPSHQNDWKETAQLPADPVDEAGMESFPASDPPAPRASVSST